MFYVVSWGFASIAITFLGSLVLARHLTPHDFGVIAIGQTVATLATVTSDGGIASGFIRRPDILPRRPQVHQWCPTSHHDPPGHDHHSSGAPVRPCWIPDRAHRLVAADREPAGRRARRADTRAPISGDRVHGSTWNAGVLRVSIAGVLMGHGVWSLASGMLIRAVVSTLVIGGIVGWATIVPSFRRYHDVLGVMGFGIGFSMTNLTYVLYEQAKNVIIVLIGGINALGIWALATRILQLPALIFRPIDSVAFPAFAQVISSGRNPRPVLERVARLFRSFRSRPSSVSRRITGSHCFALR